MRVRGMQFYGESYQCTVIINTDLYKCRLHTATHSSFIFVASMNESPIIPAFIARKPSVSRNLVRSTSPSARPGPRVRRTRARPSCFWPRRYWPKMRRRRRLPVSSATKHSQINARYRCTAICSTVGTTKWW